VLVGSKLGAQTSDDLQTWIESVER